MENVQTINASKAQRPGEVLLQHGLASDALPHLLAARKEEPSHWRHPLNLAIAYRYLGKFDEAYESLHAARTMCPEAWPVYHTWANVLDDLGQFQPSLDMRWKAWELCGRSRQEVALGLAVALLRKGQWEQGWPFWEMGRFMYSWKPPVGLSVWQGEPIRDKRILVLSEGGYGDVFQFARWLPFLALQGGADVTLYVWERQIELLKKSVELKDVKMVAIGSELKVEDYDFCTSILSLPSLFASTPKTVPPSLSFDIPSLERFIPGKRIGICWKAEENGSVRRVRTIPDDTIDVLRTFPATWFSLVPRETLDWMHLGSETWAETAELIKSLDLVVSVDTAVLHLAGCLGVPTIALLPVNAEWRWMTGINGLPWYNNVSLVRAEKHDDWEPVVEKVLGALRG